MKSVIMSLKELMKVKSQFDELTHLFKDASDASSLISFDEKNKQNAWFSSIAKYNKGFMEDVKIWLSETDKRSGRPSSDTVTGNFPGRRNGGARAHWKRTSIISQSPE